VFDLDHIPDESVLSRTWHKRFDGGVRGFVQIVAHLVVKEAHDRYFSAHSIRPKSEVVDEKSHAIEYGETTGREFTDKQIYRTTRLARDHGFEGFDTKIGDRRVYRQLGNSRDSGQNEQTRDV